MSGSETNTTAVFIVEDHEIMRRMLAKIIQYTSGLTLCGEAASAEAALKQIPDCQPQLVLIDVSLPGMDGIELIGILSQQNPDLLLLAVSGHDENVYAADALRAGARGYVMKGKLEKLEEAIRHVCNGGIYVSDAVRAILDENALPPDQ
ncbi:MAG: response regulator transcription factor [Chloroflexi bacterium]|nr:response regulator transcription factor [Chloroflexota bacterium]MCI0644223.1 response regulator transcription factor [Chloroflexota bacterium]MCI0727542.1 response regulator transcription factor [Chloroflexota bacterium]